jgi:YHS domain-containing protein
MQDLLRRSVMGALVGFAAAPLGSVLAAEPAVVPAKRMALQGYDPVSYFTNGRPEKGSPEFTAAFDDATYWFKSAEHRAMFAADPERYAPQFGGFCAISLTRGEVVEPDPESWVIADGKLSCSARK